MNSKQRENKKITATYTNCPLLNYLILTAKLYLYGVVEEIRLFQV